MRATGEPAAQDRPRASRAGYAISIVINAILLYLVNVQPTWTAVPFLTDQTPRVLVLVNASMIAGIVVNLVYLATDPPLVKAAGGLVTTGIGLAAMLRIWKVFPFDLTGHPVLGPLVRIGLVVGIIGSVIGLVVQVVAMVRAIVSAATATRPR